MIIKLIYTSLVGYLKAHAGDLFENQLPESKMQVIRDLGFGTVDKIYLEFDRPFWDAECAGIVNNVVAKDIKGSF